MKNNKWINGAIPALLLHLSVGSVYAWSLFVNSLSEYMNYSTGKIQFTFSLAIFFLGMSAAFGGKLVEKNIHKSSVIGMLCFIFGLLISALAIHLKSLWLLYLGYGCIGGVGLGITYLTPCKTLMLWFKDNKGLAMGLSVMGFGFASSIASPLITFLIRHVKLYNIFMILSIIYFVLMIIGCLLLKKPKEYENLDANNTNKFNYIKVIKEPFFVLSWLMFYLNIHCGLALIGIAAPILQNYNVSAIVIAAIISVMGVFNGAGRIIYSTISDFLNKRILIYLIIFILSIISVLLGMTCSTTVILAIMLCIISSTYGAGFSNIAPLLSDYFGIENISKIHGMILTAWALAGLTGNNMSVILFNIFNNYKFVFLVLLILYVISLICSFIIYKKYDNKIRRENNDGFME